MSRFLLLFVFTASGSLTGSTDTGIKGSIRDELGAAIGKATVVVTTNPMLSTRTNDSGGFAVAIRDEGLYDVFVSAPGFAPTCTKLQVKAHHWAVFSPTLTVDPLTVKSHGDTFDTRPPRSRKK